MTKANECTCPSGDGSLRHPCPAHPAVEQAGGDERAVDGKPRATKCPDCGEGDLMPGDLCACGYETDPAAGYACSECDGSGDGYVGEVCRECDGSGWFVTPEQARAALAQPSPPPHPASELDFSRPLETENGDPVKWICADVIEYKSARVCVAKDTGLVYSSPYIGLKIRNVMPEQAEAERPEVAEVAFVLRNIGAMDAEDIDGDNVDLRFEDAEGRDTGCDVSIVEYAEKAADLLEQQDRIVGELRADRDSWAEQAEQRLADWDEMRKERDAALVEVERLRESKGDPVGSFEKCMKVMYERDEHAKRLEVALARVAEMEAKLAELEKQEPIGWWAQYCETPMRRMVHWGAKGPECTSEEFHPFYAAPFVKAQHRVPGKYDEVLLPFLKSMEHELHANAGKGDRPGWLQMDRKTALLEIYYHLGKLQKATKGNDTAGIVEYAADVANMSMMLVDVCGLLAAAPGKEVGHE